MRGGITVKPTTTTIADKDKKGVCHECFNGVFSAHVLKDCAFAPDKKFTGDECGYEAEDKQLIKRRIDYLLMRLILAIRLEIYISRTSNCPSYKNKTWIRKTEK